MIESKKQYDETLDFLKINRFAYDEANEIDDLIETLREVAKHARDVGAFFRHKELLDALAALPDWIKKDG